MSGHFDDALSKVLAHHYREGIGTLSEGTLHAVTQDMPDTVTQKMTTVPLLSGHIWERMEHPRKPTADTAKLNIPTTIQKHLLQPDIMI